MQDEKDDFLDLIASDEIESHLMLSRMLRGAIIASFTEVEFLVTDLIARCLSHSDYRDVLKGKLPYSLDRRLTMAKRLFGIGILRIHEAQAVSLIDRLSEFEDLRHMMAHGLLVVREGDCSIVFRRYDHEKNGVLSMKCITFTLDELAEQHRVIGRYSLGVAELFSEIFKTLPPPQFEAR